MAQDVGTHRWRERAALASPKRSPHWSWLGGETDGVVPLKAQNQPTPLPTTPSTCPPKPLHICCIIHVPREIWQRTFSGAGTTKWWHLARRLNNCKPVTSPRADVSVMRWPCYKVPGRCGKANNNPTPRRVLYGKVAILWKIFWFHVDLRSVLYQANSLRSPLVFLFSVILIAHLSW